jgi:DNA-binding LacI/PurR family transcriptional regulator
MNRGSGHSRPTQSDVARVAGVSRATVSMVMSGRTGTGAAISAKTRNHVLEVAARMGYSANPVARSLAGGRNKLLGVYTFAPMFPAEREDFYYPFLVGVEREAEQLRYDLVLFTGAVGPGRQRLIYSDNVNRLRLADGCILLGRDTDRAELDRLAEEDFPFVSLGRREVPGREIAYVAADYRGATIDIVTRLASLGHRRIAYVASGLDFEPLRDRADGYRRGMDLNDLERGSRFELIASADSLQASDVHALFAAGVTAIVTETQPITLRFRELASSAGLRPPEDYSIVMAGPPPGGDEATAGLSMPRREMGALAVRMLADMLGDTAIEPRRQVTVPCEVIAGNTIGPPSPAGAYR